MFAYVSVSSVQPSSRERPYEVAYLQAIFPEQSETSRYRVVVMDRDGSNRRTIFPANDAPGLERLGEHVRQLLEGEQLRDAAVELRVGAGALVFGAAQARPETAVRDADGGEGREPQSQQQPVAHAHAPV